MTRNGAAAAYRSIDLDPVGPQGHCALGRAYQLRGEIDAATENLATAVQLGPSSILSLYSLSRSLYFEGRFDAAAAPLAQARAGDRRRRLGRKTRAGAGMGR